jgi:hypothetical protein
MGEAETGLAVTGAAVTGGAVSAVDGATGVVGIG